MFGYGVRDIQCHRLGAFAWSRALTRLIWRRTKEAPQTRGSQVPAGQPQHQKLAVPSDGKKSADFWFSRRVEGRPSVPFLLCGDVAREAAALAA